MRPSSTHMISISQRLHGLTAAQTLREPDVQRARADPDLDTILDTHMHSFQTMIRQLHDMLQREQDPRKLLLQHDDEQWYMFLPFRRSPVAWFVLHYYPNGQVTWQPAFHVPSPIEEQGRVIANSW